MESKVGSRLAASAVLCLLTVAVAVTHREPHATPAAAPQPHARHVLPRDGVAVSGVTELDRTGWTITRSATELTIDTHGRVAVDGLSYRPAGASRVARYEVRVSADGDRWGAPVATGTLAGDELTRSLAITPSVARYVRLRALEGDLDGAEVGLLRVTTARMVPVAGARSAGSWSAPIGFPLVPAAAAQLPNGKILAWSAFQPDDYHNGTGRTETALYDPATGRVTRRTVTRTGHDMFCPGLSALPDGRLIVTGGNDSRRTSFYDPASDSWKAGPDLVTPRGYQSTATLGDGRVFTVGGSWSGGIGGLDGTAHKSGEVWSPTGGWKSLPGADVVPMLTDDRSDGDFRKDNHAWLFSWTGNKVLQAGPSRAMNWYTTTGRGGVSPAGTRGDDGDAMNGNAVMYDTGKILTVGGAPHYEQAGGTRNAYAITIEGSSSVRVRKLAPMANARAFHNSVVLPDGTVAVLGGQNWAAPFSDDTAVRTVELWDPDTGRFSTLSAAAVPRTYHSVALLMPDGRVFTGGGGMCGSCGTNHFDGEIFTPPYLLDDNGRPAPRPVLSGTPATIGNGKTFTVRTDRAVSRFAIVRMGTATHSVNTDQRRLSLPATKLTSTSYRLSVPADRGVALPGYWMLFALDAKGVPSIARTIRIG